MSEHRRFRARLGGTLLGLAAVTSLVLTASATGVSSWTVTRFDDPAGPGNCPTDCSLRQAIAGVGDGGTINLPAGTYTLTRGQLATPGTGETITITGAGARTTTIEQTTAAPNTERVIQVVDTIDLSGVTVTGGSTGGANGNPNEPFSGQGGGILVSGSGALHLSDAIVTGNTAFSDGGGIYNFGGTMTIDRSLISSNQASGSSGGGILESGGGDTITNSTIVNNSAADGGGVLAFENVSLLNDTLAGNSASRAGDSVSGGSSVVTAENTIFSDVGGSNSACDAAIGSTGNNIDSDGSCVGSGPGDLTSTDPKLGPLQDNGGPTDTEAPAPGSPAIDAGNDANCPAVDQRSVKRPVGPHCDIGAVEGAEGPLITSQRAVVGFDTSGQVAANIDPNGAGTTYKVEYGTTSAYGQQTSPVDIGTSQQDVTATVTGLQPQTTYHFRFDATNANGTTFSTDGSFTTGQAFTATAGTLFSTSNLVTGSSDGCPTGVSVDWGDGTPKDTVVPTCPNGSTFVVAGSHTYAEAAHYTVTVGPVQGRLFGAGVQVAAAPAPPSGTTPAPPAAPALGAPSLTTATGVSATVAANVNPNGDTTSVVVQYGPTASYGKQTAAVTLTAAQTATVQITGLAPSATYHYRFVATNGGGTTNGTDASFITTTGGTTFSSNETPPPPTQGQNANVLPFLGTVLVDGKPLLVGEQIPFGATVDTTKGTVVIQTVDDGVLQTWQFAGGVFVLTQLADGTTLLTLTGGDFTTICKTTSKGTRHTAAVVAKQKNKKQKNKKAGPKTVRSLWGNGTGHFQVKGRYAAASVRGTVFHVVDRCDGTLVHVRHGLVAVVNLKTGKIVLVPAGKSALVPAP